MREAAALVLGVCLGQADAPAEAPEYVVKSVFLLNFAKYVQWPPGTFPTSDAPIYVGVLGRDPFGPELDATLKGKRVQGRFLKVRRFGRPRDVRDVHILFVPRGEEERLSEILERIRGQSILIVGEGESFCREGGVLSVLIEKGKPRIEANPDAAARADLTIDAKLLKVATIIRGAP